MRPYPQLILVMVLCLASAGCRSLETPPSVTISPVASAPITMTPTIKPSSVVRPTTPTSPPSASETPALDSESGTEGHTAESEGISASLYFDRPGEGGGTGGKLEDLWLSINRYGQLVYEGPAAQAVPFDYFIKAPLSIASPPQFYNLDGDAEEEIVLQLLEDGADCCAHTIIADYTPNEFDPFKQYVFTMKTWGPSRTFPSFLDLDADGKMELVSQSERFSSDFGAIARSGVAPVQIWRYTPDGLQDVTRDFPETIRQDAERWWNSYINEGSDQFEGPAALSAYVAGRCMLENASMGEQIDWSRAEDIYDRSAQGATRAWQDYLAQLAQALDANGYACPSIFPAGFSLPTASPRPTREPLVPASFDPASFSYDPSFVSEIGSETLLANPNAPDYFKLPDHLLIAIDEDTPCPDPAYIHVIPVDDYIRVNPAVEKTIADFRNLLDLKPTAIPHAERILDLLPSNAAQGMKTAISYLDFRNGSGARALILYTQNLTFAAGCNFDYVFQGLTQDGRFLISARIPIFIPVLDENSVEGKYLFNERNYYIQYIEALVGNQPAENFSPDLSILDEMMRSFSIE